MIRILSERGGIISKFFSVTDSIGPFVNNLDRNKLNFRNKFWEWALSQYPAQPKNLCNNYTI